jgi:hypothetical protein
LWLIETDVFQLPQPHKHFNVSGNFMTDFKSKFIYPVFILRLLLLLSLVGAISLFIFIGIPSLAKQHSGLKALGLISFGLALFGYLTFVLGKSTLTQRYNVVIEDGQVLLRDNLVGKHNRLDENFRGFSLSNYGDRRAIYEFKTLIFYFQSGRKIEFPQFLYSNFKHILPSLTAHSVHYFGQEPYRWKNLVSRHYFFD